MGRFVAGKVVYPFVQVGCQGFQRGLQFVDLGFQFFDNSVNIHWETPVGEAQRFTSRVYTMSDPGGIPEFQVHTAPNLEAMRGLQDNSIDLIATDPPYYTGLVRAATAGEYSDNWDSRVAFLADMRASAVEMRRVLRPGGTLYWQCEPHEGAYIRVMLDEIFDDYVTTITWRRSEGLNGSTTWGAQTDFIYMYGRRAVNREVEYASDEHPGHRYVDDLGEYTRHAMVIRPLPGHTPAPDLLLPWRGLDVNARGYRWRLPRHLPDAFDAPEGFDDLPFPEKLDALYEQGFVHQIRGSLPYLKLYVKESKGRLPTNLWTDIKRLANTDGERVGYPTQKPVSLYERMIKASSAEGDIVLDPFCGSGTTGVAAVRHGRDFIGIDQNPVATDHARQRLVAEINARGTLL